MHAETTNCTGVEYNDDGGATVVPDPSVYCNAAIGQIEITREAWQQAGWRRRVSAVVRGGACDAQY